MINLLPPQDKKDLKAGLANRLLVRYLFIFLALAVFMLLSLAAVYLYLTSTKSTAEDNIANNEADSMGLMAQQQLVTEFQSDLATAKQILDKQTNYSSMLLKIAATIPGGVSLESIELDAETIGQPTKLNIQTNSEQAAVNFKNTLERSPYFDDIHFDNLSLNDGEDSEYAYSAVMTVTFTKELLDGPQE